MGRIRETDTVIVENKVGDRMRWETDKENDKYKSYTTGRTLPWLQNLQRPLIRQH